MQDHTTHDDTRKPGRPPKPPVQRLIDSAEGLTAIIQALPEMDRFNIARELNMRHGVMLSELTEGLDSLVTISKRRLNSV